MSDAERNDPNLVAREYPDLPDHTGLDAVEPDSAGAGESSGKGSIITLTTVIVLLLATALTVLGIGATDNAVANYDASSWLWSSGRGEMDRVNAVTARVDTRTKIKDAQNHDIQISQTDRYLILRDLDTGEVSALDLTNLQVSAVLPTTPGLGVSVALHGESAFVVDAVQGQVRQLDPRSLAPTGDAITLPNGISPGGFDGKGSLWIAVPGEGTVVAIAPGVKGTSPKVVRTVTVADPGHDLEVSCLDDGIAVLDNTTQTLVVVRGDKVDRTAVPIDAPGILPARTNGTSVPITVAEDRKVVVATGKKTVTFTAPGTGPLLAAVAYSGRIYAPDPRAGVVYEFNAAGKLVKEITMPAGGGQIELDVREGYLFINAPDGSNARVVDQKFNVRDVNKYQEGVLGADPPPPPPQVDPPKPVKAVPGRPPNVTANAGDASATVTWRRAADNGAAVTKYVIEGGPEPITVGAKQRSVEIKGLTNAKKYTFTVHAVNSVGAGPKGTSPEVMPTADVPDAPASAQATAKGDGTVDVTWAEANGQGRKILSYTVTSIAGGVQAPVGSVTGTTMTIAKGSLTYGTQYAFTVVAINDRNAGSPSSPVSNTVVPFTNPGPPLNVSAATKADQRGAIQVAWRAAQDNGRKIDKYVVTAAGQAPIEVRDTTVTLTGFADDSPVEVSIYAVNEAGNGPEVKASARTIGVPEITVVATSADYHTMWVTFTPQNKGGAAVCSLTVQGATASTGCANAPVTLAVTALWPNRTYDFTASVATAAGTASASGTQASAQVRFTVLCANNDPYCRGGVYAYAGPSQQGRAINPPVGIGATGMPMCHIAGNRPIDARPWGGKDSDLWLKFNYNGADVYFPFAWVSLDGGDNIGILPQC